MSTETEGGRAVRVDALIGPSLGLKIETGVMVMKNGKAWGQVYADGHATEYGWMPPENAPIHDPTYCTKPTDVTWRGSHYTVELSTAELVMVTRKTEVFLRPNASLTGGEAVRLKI